MLKKFWMGVKVVKKFDLSRIKFDLSKELNLAGQIIRKDHFQRLEKYHYFSFFSIRCGSLVRTIRRHRIRHPRNLIQVMLTRGRTTRNLSTSSIRKSQRSTMIMTTKLTETTYQRLRHLDLSTKTITIPLIDITGTKTNFTLSNYYFTNVNVGVGTSMTGLASGGYFYVDLYDVTGCDSITTATSTITAFVNY